MSSKRVRLISLTGIILIALVIGVSVLVNRFSKEILDVNLPIISASDSVTDGIGVSDNNELDQVKITTDNVQDVIASLKRPPYYTRTIKIEDEYAVYDIAAAVTGANTALEISFGQTKKKIIIADGKLYIWFDGDKTSYSRPINLSADEKKSPDEYQKILSYEDVLVIDKSSITAADYVEYSGEKCIYVQYVSALLHYTTKCYISVKTGLLLGAQQYDGSTLIYSMTSSGYNAEEPVSSVFDLPDGKSALSVP